MAYSKIQCGFIKKYIYIIYVLNTKIFTFLCCEKGQDKLEIRPNIANHIVILFTIYFLCIKITHE